MSDEIAKSLGRFTPSTAGLDQNVLLFEAGRAAALAAQSAQPCKALAGVLMVSQTLLLCAIPWLRAPAGPPEIQLAEKQVAPEDRANHPPPSLTLAVAAKLPSNSLLRLRDLAIRTGGNLPLPKPVDSLIDNELLPWGG